MTLKEAAATKVEDIVKGDAVLRQDGDTNTVKRVRHYTDVVVIWWTDSTTPTTATKGLRMDVIR